MIITILLFCVLSIAHYSLSYLHLLPGDVTSYKIVDVILIIIFSSGTFFTYLGLKKGPENFNMRFLIVTTFQMLSMLSLATALIYKKIEHVQTVVFSSISLFVILLAVQSFFLIKKVNSK